MLDTNEWNIDIPARLNDVVDESLNEITKMHRRKVGKRIGTVCGSVFAFVGAFFIFGFANPALASEIPLLGNLFRQVNTDGKVYGPANIDSYGLVREVGKTAETDNPDCSLTVVNAYSDGSTIQIGLELAFSGDLADLADRYAWIDTQYGGASTVTVNGEEPPLVQMNGFFYRAEKWVSTVNLNVPDSQKNAETFRVSMALQGFSGLVKESIAGNQTTREPLDSAFTVEFPVEADRDNGFSFRCEAEDNGAKVLGVSGTPARTVISVEKPYWGEAVPGAVDLTAPDCYPKGFPYLYTEDGEEIQRNASATQDQGGYDSHCRETQTADLYFDGVPAGTSRVVLKFIEGDVSDRVLAEFSIDLEKRAVTPAGTVISEEEDPPFDTVIGFQKGPEENGYSVEAVALTSNGRESTGLVQFTTQSGSRKKPERLRVEVRDSQGNLLFASDSVTEAGLGVWNEEEWTTAVADIDAPPDADPVAYGVNTREIGFAGSVEELQGERVTTTVTSLQSGEVLCTDTRVLDVLQSGR